MAGQKTGITIWTLDAELDADGTNKELQINDQGRRQRMKQNGANNEPDESTPTVEKCRKLRSLR